MSIRIKKALLLAAGLGTRMAAISNGLPKPLQEVAGCSLLVHGLERLVGAHIEEIIVNIHYKAELIEKACREWQGEMGDIRLGFSDERGELMDTGGAIKKALPLLGSAPFLVQNSDILWRERESNILRLAEYWRDEMGGLLLLTPAVGKGDFVMGEDGVLKRAGEGVGFTYCGVQVLAPKLLADMGSAPFSCNRLWDNAIAARSLFGLVLAGEWLHIGTPEQLAIANKVIGED